jgi:heme exporter protein C
LMALRASIEEKTLAGKLTAVLALVGVVILPVIKFSVDWWNTLHQPAGVLKGALDPVFLTPLLFSAAGFTLLFLALHMKGMRNEILSRRVLARQLKNVDRASADAATADAGAA